LRSDYVRNQLAGGQAAHSLHLSLAIDGARPGTLKKIDCGVFLARLKRDKE
jgi:hypothetical protein